MTHVPPINGSISHPSISAQKNSLSLLHRLKKVEQRQRDMVKDDDDDETSSASEEWSRSVSALYDQISALQSSLEKTKSENTKLKSILRTHSDIRDVNVSARREQLVVTKKPPPPPRTPRERTVPPPQSLGENELCQRSLEKSQETTTKRPPPSPERRSKPSIPQQQSPRVCFDVVEQSCCLAYDPAEMLVVAKQKQPDCAVACCHQNTASDTPQRTALKPLNSSL